MIMYIETDSNGKIIIQDISQEEAIILDDCLYTYLATKPIDQRSSVDRIVMDMKRQLEKEYTMKARIVYEVECPPVNCDREDFFEMVGTKPICSGSVRHLR